MSNKTKLIVFIFCIAKLSLHLIADAHSGFQGDELLHIETGKHLAFGFMEFPPLIGVFAFIQNLFNSNVIYVHHLFAHIASILIVIYVAKTTFELGGKNKAIILALLCILIGPGFGRSQQLFQPVVFSQLFWVLSFYQLIRFVKHPDKKSLWYLTMFVVLGCSVKYDAMFFVFSLTSLLLFKRTRHALLLHHFWLNIIVAIVLLTPNLIWQNANDFPILQMINRLYETQLDQTSRLSNLGKLLIGINPISSLLIILPAFIYLFRNNKKVYLPIVISIFLSVAFLLIKNGKSYYFYPIALTLIPFGALFWEKTILPKRTWLIYPLLTLFAFGAILIPFGMPVYTFKHYLASVYKYEKKSVEGGKYGVKYEEYYSKEKWKETMQQLEAVYDSLPTNAKQSVLIWGKHYGQAGAVNLFGTAYNLPHAFSFHGSFYSWVPKGQMPNTTIALSYQVGDFFNTYFDDVKLVRTIYNPYAYNEEELYQNIYICRKPKQNIDSLKKYFKNRIFE